MSSNNLLLLPHGTEMVVTVTSAKRERVGTLVEVVSDKGATYETFISNMECAESRSFTTVFNTRPNTFWPAQEAIGQRAKVTITDLQQQTSDRIMRRCIWSKP